MTIQITLFSTTGKYRPISTLVEVDSVADYKARKKEIHTKAIQKICAKRYVDGHWLVQNGYTQLKARVYNKEKIEAENKKRYEEIKKERGWA